MTNTPRRISPLVHLMRLRCLKSALEHSTGGGSSRLHSSKWSFVSLNGNDNFQHNQVMKVRYWYYFNSLSCAICSSSQMLVGGSSQHRKPVGRSMRGSYRFTNVAAELSRCPQEGRRWQKAIIRTCPSLSVNYHWHQPCA